MTVLENMDYGLKNRKLSKAEIQSRVEGAAHILELSHLLTRRPRQLSGGQRQRVAMGRAIVRDPKVFLFDEPLSNLDAKLRVQMRLEIQRSEEHTSELQSLMRISYAVFRLKKKNIKQPNSSNGALKITSDITITRLHSMATFTSTDKFVCIQVKTNTTHTTPVNKASSTYH